MNHILNLQSDNRNDTSSEDEEEDDLDCEPDPLLLLPETPRVEEFDHVTPRSLSPEPTPPTVARRSRVIGAPSRRRSGYTSEEPNINPTPPPPPSWEDESDDELLLRPPRRLSNPINPVSTRVTRHRRHAHSMSSAMLPLAPLQLSRLPRISDLPDADEKERTELIKSAILASSPEVTSDSLSSYSSCSPVARKLDSCQSEFKMEDEDMEELVRSVHKTLIGQSKD
jgi:hypothetical protein